MGGRQSSTNARRHTHVGRHNSAENSPVAAVASSSRNPTQGLQFLVASDQGVQRRRRRRDRNDMIIEAHSLPAHLFPSFFPADIKCPVCNKRIVSDQIESHLLACLSKPKVSYNEDILKADAGECIICFDDMSEGDKIARLPCLCIYHKHCIDDWFKRNRCCPEHPDQVPQASSETLFASSTADDTPSTDDTSQSFDDTTNNTATNDANITATAENVTPQSSATTEPSLHSNVHTDNISQPTTTIPNTSTADNTPSTTPPLESSMTNDNESASNDTTESPSNDTSESPLSIRYENPSVTIVVKATPTTTNQNIAANDSDSASAEPSSVPGCSENIENTNTEDDNTVKNTITTMGEDNNRTIVHVDDGSLHGSTDFNDGDEFEQLASKIKHIVTVEPTT